MKITVFCEHTDYMINKENVGKVYPKGLGQTIQDIFGKNTNLVLINEQTDGSELLKYLDETDVLVWWGHTVHNNVSEEVNQKVCDRVRSGMGFIPLHSAHLSKPFRSLMGTTCSLKWREDEGNEILWSVNPTHPICEGIGECVHIDKEEMYGEFFDIPTPDELIFIGWFKGGEVFRAGCVFNRGMGKIFYFNPGHETYPTYKNAEIKKIIRNAAKYVCPKKPPKLPVCTHTEPENKK